MPLGLGINKLNNMSYLRNYAKVSLLVFLLNMAHVSTSISARGLGVGNNEFGSNNNSSDHFLYFAYGSNLLKERIHVRNPSATFVTTGRLMNHTLRFGHYNPNFDGSNSWHGGVATIEQSDGEDVWGVVWRLENKNLISLDRQEGVKSPVSNGMYRPLEVHVLTDEGEMLCRTYQMNNFKPYLTSPPYKKVVCLGAIQNGLPQHYVDKLEALETNGYSGPSVLDQIPNLSPTDKKLHV